MGHRLERTNVHRISSSPIRDVRGEDVRISRWATGIVVPARDGRELDGRAPRQKLATSWRETTSFGFVFFLAAESLGHRLPLVPSFSRTVLLGRSSPAPLRAPPAPNEPLPPTMSPLPLPPVDTTVVAVAAFSAVYAATLLVYAALCAVTWVVSTRSDRFHGKKERKS